MAFIVIMSQIERSRTIHNLEDPSDFRWYLTPDQHGANSHRPTSWYRCAHVPRAGIYTMTITRQSLSTSDNHRLTNGHNKPKASAWHDQSNPEKSHMKSNAPKMPSKGLLGLCLLTMVQLKIWLQSQHTGKCLHLIPHVLADSAENTTDLKQTTCPFTPTRSKCFARMHAVYNAPIIVNTHGLSCS